MEPTYVHYVTATYEKPPSSGPAAWQFLKVKTGVLPCTTGDLTQDTLIRDHINSMLLDVISDSFQVPLPHRCSTPQSFWGPRRPWRDCMTTTSRQNVSTDRPWTRKRNRCRGV